MMYSRDPGCMMGDNKDITGARVTNEWRREKSYQDAISLLTKETEITGDIVFLLPEKFTHKIAMALQSF